MLGQSDCTPNPGEQLSSFPLGFLLNLMKLGSDSCAKGTYASEHTEKGTAGQEKHRHMRQVTCNAETCCSPLRPTHVS